MGADDRGRELSMAYMHGYINGKANRTTLDLDKNAAITDKVREYCLSNPTAKFAKTFENLSKISTRRWVYILPGPASMTTWARGTTTGRP